MNDIATGILNAIDRALAPSRPGDPFAVMTRAICDGAGKTFANKAQRAELAQKQLAYEECGRVIEQHWPIKARDAWMDHHRELQEAIRRGDLDKADGYSREELEAEFEAKMEAAKAERCAVTMSCAEIVKELSEQFASVADRFAAEQAKFEAEAYAKFGVPYAGPSSLVKALRQAADMARRRVPRPGFPRSPREMLPFVDF
jgi:hypothetical protein